MTTFKVIFPIFALFAVSFAADDNNVDKVFRAAEVVPDVVDESPETFLKVNIYSPTRSHKINYIFFIFFTCRLFIPTICTSKKEMS